MFSSISDLHSLNPSVTLSLCDKKKKFSRYFQMSPSFCGSIAKSCPNRCNPISFILATHIFFLYLFLCYPFFHWFFSHSVLSDSLWTHGLQHAKIPCPSPSPRVCSNSFTLSQWCHPTILSSIACFSSCLQSFLSSASFPMCWLFASENEVTQSCPTLCDPMNGSLPGFSIHGIFQARTVESVAISFSREPLGKLDQVFHMGHPPCVRGYPVSTQATSPSQGVTAVILHCQFILQSFGASASVLFTLY